MATPIDFNAMNEIVWQAYEGPVREQLAEVVGPSLFGPGDPKLAKWIREEATRDDLIRLLGACDPGE